MTSEVIPVDAPVLHHLLAPGERLTDGIRQIQLEDGFRAGYAYDSYEIVDSEDCADRSVFFVMPDAGDYTEPVTLEHDRELAIYAEQGQGLLVLYEKGADHVDLIVLDATTLRSESVLLLQGDSYAYWNIGDRPFIVRADCDGPLEIGSEVAIWKGSRMAQSMRHLGSVAFEPDD